MSERELKALLSRMYAMVQSLRGNDLPIVCGESGPKTDGMPRYLKVSPSPGVTSYAIYKLVQPPKEDGSADAN